MTQDFSAAELAQVEQVMGQLGSLLEQALWIGRQDGGVHGGGAGVVGRRGGLVEGALDVSRERAGAGRPRVGFEDPREPPSAPFAVPLSMPSVANIDCPGAMPGPMPTLPFESTVAMPLVGVQALPFQRNT